MNQPLRILIVEDEFITAEAIKDSLEEMGYLIAGMARDAEEACNILDKGETDLAILDINIQGDKDGVWVAQQINKKYELPFLFLTSYSDAKTVQNAIETEPYGYLVKPFTKADIYASIEVAVKNYFSINGDGKAGSEKKMSLEDSIFIKDSQLYRKVKLKEICYVQSELKYVQIYLKDKKFLLRYNLSDIAEMLPAEFFVQTHRSYIVNVSAVDQVGPNVVVVLDTEIPLSSGRKEEFMSRFKFI